MVKFSLNELVELGFFLKKVKLFLKSVDRPIGKAFFQGPIISFYSTYP